MNLETCVSNNTFELSYYLKEAYLSLFDHRCFMTQCAHQALRRVRSGGAPPYGQPDRKISVFYAFP